MEKELFDFIKRLNEQSVANPVRLVDFDIAPAQCGVGTANEKAIEKRIIALWKEKENSTSILKPCTVERHATIQPCCCQYQQFRAEYISKCHANHFCDVCGEKGIYGARYNCKECVFDLCQACFDAQTHEKTHSHPLTRIIKGE